MSTQYATKILKQENGITFEKVINYNDTVRDIPCIYVTQGDLTGCIVSKKNLHQTTGDDTTVDIYGMDVRYGLISPFELTKTDKQLKKGDFFFPNPTYMIYQSKRIKEATIELSLHKLDRSYGVIRFRNWTSLHRNSLIKRLSHLDGITKVVFR